MNKQPFRVKNPETKTGGLETQDTFQGSSAREKKGNFSAFS